MTSSPKPRVPLTIWLMLAVVVMFALALSYLLVFGIYQVATG
jgi:hypothetical protein